MIHPIAQNNLDEIQNPAFRKYAERYVEITQDFLAQVSRIGLEFEARPELTDQPDRLRHLQAKGVQLRNDRKSLVWKHISPSCLACRTAENSETFFISLRCHRDCYFCFNPNQEGYAHFLEHERNLKAELEQAAAQGRRLEHIALTGGEPLLHPDKTLEFFRTARRLYPEAFLRLYTSGDQLNAQNLGALAEAGLDEVRLSIRMHDLEKGHQHSFERLRQAREHIPHVLVEMPVLPGSYAAMTRVLDELDQIGADGINLLELCFPMNNADEFRKRGFKLKTPPFRVLYDYWYAGGLPIAGSEEVCLDLIQYAVDRDLRLGLHYCSLENKHSGQIHMQNSKAPQTRTGYFSSRDFFIKTAKVFGEDIAPVKQALIKTRRAVFDLHPEGNYLEFHPRHLAMLPFEVEAAISYNVFESREDGSYMRELRVDRTTPGEFRFEEDL